MIDINLKNETVIRELNSAIKMAIENEHYSSADDMNTILEFMKKTTEPTYSRRDIEQLQSKIYEITGPGEIMGMFNELLGIGC